jgi:acyl-CoA thioesterase FadM
MARIKLNIPGKILYTTSIPLRISDINYGGHLGNDSVLSLAHESRIRFLNSLNYSETDIEGVSIIMTDAIINYKNQGHYGDVIKIEIAVNDIGNNGLDMYYKMTCENNNTEVARVKTGIAFFDYKSNKLTAIPYKFIQKINDLI